MMNAVKADNSDAEQGAGSQRDSDVAYATPQWGHRDTLHMKRRVFPIDESARSRHAAAEATNAAIQALREGLQGRIRDRTYGTGSQARGRSSCQ